MKKVLGTDVRLEREFRNLWNFHKIESILMYKVPSELHKAKLVEATG